jgi:hypothetical protein
MRCVRYGCEQAGGRHTALLHERQIQVRLLSSQ